jgi:diguanylate cyclase (GGDEF)-like protein
LELCNADFTVQSMLPVRHPTRRAGSRTGWIWLLAIALLLRSLSAAALDPEKPFRHYVFDHWGIEEGLPQLSVLSITQDASGYLWVTTQNGVARFDGVRFRVFNVENTPALRANVIDRVLLGSDDSLWFGSARGLTRYHDGLWTAIELVPGRDVAVAALSDDGDGRILVGTDQGLFRVDHGLAQRIGDETLDVLALTRVGDSIFLGTHGAVHEIRGASIRVHAHPDGADAPAVSALLAAPDGLHVGTRRGLQRLVDGEWDPPEATQSLRQHRIEALYRDSDGNLWIGTTEGLYRQSPRGDLEHCQTAALPAGAWIGALFEDRERNLWIGSLTHSLVRSWNGWVSRIDGEAGLSDPFVWSVLSDENGTLWIGTNSGVERADADGRAQLVTSTRELPDSSVYNLYRTRAGDLLIGTRAGMARWDGRRLTREPQWEAFATASVHAVVEEGPGHLWIATSQGLYQEVDGSVRQVGSAEGLGNVRIRALAKSNRGELWVGSERGVYRRVDGRFRRLDQPPQLASALATAMLPWHESGMLIATLDAGLFVGVPGNMKQITTRAGLPFIGAFALANEGDWVYVSGPEGVYRLAPSDIDRFHLDGGRANGDMIIQTGTGFPGALRARCCNGGAQARIAHNNGVLWLPTLEGVLRVDSGRIRRSTLAPPAVAESLEHQGVTYEGPGPFQLDGRSGDLSIQFSGLALQDPTGVRFRYRLIGYDERWRSAGNRRTVYYTNLAPGNYRFEAVATSSAGLESPQAATLRFRLVPPFYRALWFKLLVAGAVLALIALAWQIYRRRLRAREEALELLVQQRTAELDRANERLRAANRALVEESHTDALTGLRNRRFLVQYLADWRRGQDQDHQRRLAFILIDLDHFKRVNDLHGHLAGDEVLRQIAALLIDIAGSRGIALRWGGEEFLLVMPTEAIVTATGFCESLRQQIASKELVHSGNRSLRLTASIGLALFPALADSSDGDDWNLALELADAGLYLIKTGGRNGWAIVRPRSRADSSAFGAGFSARLRQLEAAGLVLLETSLPGRGRTTPVQHE